MIVVSNVNGTPRNPDRDPDREPEPKRDLRGNPDNRDYHGEHAGGPHDPYNDDVADNLVADMAGEGTVRAQLWRAFTEWVDEYAWTIITLGVALILLDVLVVLVVLLWQVNS